MKRKTLRLGKAAMVLLILFASLSLGACSGSSRVAVGAVITTLPHGHATLVVSGVRYHYHDGYYYRPVRGGYRVVVAPVGATVVRLPKRHKVVHVRGGVYYHYRDAYYRWDARRKVYVVIRNPR